MTSKFDQIWKGIQDDEERREFNLDVDTGLAFQIRLLREKNGWSQQKLGDEIGSAQETISQWENPNYGSYTLGTLKNLAAAFDVGLMVKFAPFSEVVEWNANLSPDQLAPPSFAEEQAARAFPQRLICAPTESDLAAASTVRFSPIGDRYVISQNFDIAVEAALSSKTTTTAKEDNKYANAAA